MKKTKSTTKKTKIVGTETYTNNVTGEIKEMHVIDICDSDANFHKIWMGHIMDAFDIMGNQKIKVLSYLLSHMNKENLIIATYPVISKATGVSIQTIQTTMKILKEGNVITSVQKGVYRVNPDIIFKGYNSKRMNILITYNSERNIQDKNKKGSDDND